MLVGALGGSLFEAYAFMQYDRYDGLYQEMADEVPEPSVKPDTCAVELDGAKQ